MRKSLVAASVAAVVTCSGAGTATASAEDGPQYTSTTQIAPGVVFRTFQTNSAGGLVVGDLLEVDLHNPHVRVGLLHPPAIAQRAQVSAMANAQRAVAGVNADFFNISETHPGIVPTGSSDGPEIADGRDLKGAVPDGQRFGPALPPGTSTKDVLGVGRDHEARVTSLRLTGSIRTPHGRLPLRGLNQYALPVGGIGAYTADWGATSRARAVCGTDAVRSDPCSLDAAEVTVRRGVVTQVSDVIGAGPIPRDTTVLVGREEGADALRGLRPGDRVRIRHDLAGPGHLRFAVGGFPILHDGAPLTGLDAVTRAPRTGAGVSRNGRRLYLVVVDGRLANSAGMTVAELSAFLAQVGADDGMNMDGGGSSTFAVRGPGEPSVTVRNTPSDGSERPVANGIGIFTWS
ncbi:phosphodiester glycosidase family protein [Actinoallomurus sp. NPDC050550]|uniref:phosphodiester glycosidase family protein n=1 Tax=Actinoallomurus sp. NPDC050550 TaxID=3154937 RepID=UPI0033C861E3